MSELIDANLNPFIALFLSFFFTKLAERVHKGKKVRLFKDRHTQSTMERQLQENGLALGVESCVTS